jgi:hypothetical protein
MNKKLQFKDLLKPLLVIAFLSFSQIVLAQTAQTLPYIMSNTAGSASLTSVNGWSQSGIGSDYSSPGSNIKFDTSADQATLYIASSPGLLSYNLKSNGLSGSYIFDLLESSDGVSFSVTQNITSGIGTNNTIFQKTLLASTRYIRWRYTTKATGNIGFGGVNIQALSGCTPPTTQSTVTFPAETSSNINVALTGGNGAGRVVIVNTVNSFTAPVNGSNPTANTVYGSGQQVVYNDSGSSFWVTGLSPTTTYYFRSYEYCATERNYNTTATTYSHDTAVSTNPLLSVSGSLSHGSVCPSTAATPITYTITNNGINAADGITIDSTNPTEFAISALSSTSIPGNGGTATYVVTFTPTSVGTKSASLTISSTTAGSNIVNNALTGSGIDIPPTITTPSSEVITYNSATLGGNITVQGCSSITERGIYYSTTSGFANGVGTKVSTTGTYTTGAFTIPVTGLTSNTVYYYKAFALSASGTSYSTQGTFTTSVISAPVANAASTITNTSFDANWNGVVGTTGYRLDVSKSQAFGTTNSLVVNEGFESGLTTSYQTGNVSLVSGNWDVTTVLAGITGVNSGTKSAQLQSATDAALVSPLFNNGISTISFWISSSVSNGAVQVNYSTDNGITWLVTSNSPYTGINGTKIQVSANIGTTVPTKIQIRRTAGTIYIDDVIINTYTLIPDLIAGYENLNVGNVLTYNVTGLDSGTKYYYRVRATDGSSVSINSNVIDVTTTGAVRWISTTATNWSTASNWSNNAVPDGTKDIEIPVGNPILNTNFTVQAGKSLTLSGTGTLTVAPTASLTVQGTADFGGKAVLLQSSVAGDAVIGEITGTLSNATNVTVERYIPARRAWKALTTPLKGSDTSLYSAWQNGGSTIANTGVEIWGPAGTNMSIGPNYSVLNYTATGWANVTNTATANLFNTTGNNAYLVFVTGAYGSGNISNGLSAATTLKATGELITGDVLYTNIISTKHSLLGNPYASPLDPSKILDGSVNLIPSFWVWDPSLATTGGYVAYDDLIGTYSNNTGSYTSNTIGVQSGQSFFVKANIAATGALTLSEAVKSTSVSNVFGKNANQNINNSINASILRVGMFKESNQEWKPLDGAVAGFYDTANNLVDDSDGKKFYNGGENIAFVRNNITMSSEHFSTPQPLDEMYMRVWNTSVNNYKLRINTESFTVLNIEATLVDLFTGVQTPIVLDGTVQEYPFAVTSAALSTGDRFKVVFSASILATETIDSSAIKVYPNPATNGTIHVQLPDGDYANYSFELVNVLGQKVLSNTIEVLSGNQFSFNTKGLANNWYALRILNAGKAVYQTKVIIAN